MNIIQNYTMKKNIVKKILPLVMVLLQGIKNLFGPMLMTWTARATAFHFSGSLGITCTRTSFNNSIADSPTRRYGESIFVYEYLHDFEAKIKTARKLVYRTYFFGLTVVINERIL